MGKLIVLVLLVFITIQLCDCAPKKKKQHKECKDENKNCATWAKKGDCSKKTVFQQCKVSCGSCSECFMGVDNRFKINVRVTQTGRTCQRWDSDKPHRLKWYRRWWTFPDKNITAAENFCRNPDGDRKPWCHTTDKKSFKEYCETPVCKGFEDCYYDDTQTYRGNVSVTKSGKTCLRWDSATVKNSIKKDIRWRMYSYFPDNSRSPPHNYCRQPMDKDRGKFTPYCYIGPKKYEMCNVKKCPVTCRHVAENVNYYPNYKDRVKVGKRYNTKKETQEECVELCKKTKGCNNWIYYTNEYRSKGRRKMCYLIKKFRRFRVQDGINSGYKNPCPNK